MSSYATKAIKVKAKLARKGQAGSVIRTVTTGGGPSDTSGGTATATPYAVSLVVFPIDQGRVDGTNIKQGDYQVICSTAEIEIAEDDKIQCSEGTLTIADLGRFAPDGTIIFYDMVCRG